MELQTRQRLLLLVGVLVLLYGLWQAYQTRYWYVAAGEGRMYRADRWTGEILYVIHSEAYWVKMPPPWRGRPSGVE